eukprot:TRINITY_DN80024_c0_g1_i1.p1 TRINITY_DN80024_c0_g1~~TRINITY_DN80024_c0_g1_i1.p1  ORF type:complete len:440 (-),score=105.91 TRINITY_DN80024_c0_g1_i1:96-1415(-)
MAPLCSLLGVATLVGLDTASAASLRYRSRATVGVSDYSFLEFTREYGREYSMGSSEYREREATFKQSLERIELINAKNQKEGRTWKAGIHQFMDWSQAERKALNGYKSAGRSLMHSQGLSNLQLNATGRVNGLRASSATLNEESGGLSYEGGPQIRDQGNCGSCWAVSAVEALEAQLQRHGLADRSLQLSPQALVDCVPNPQHCGGSGGCEGATGELAYAFVRDHGIPAESDLPYNAKTNSCPNQGAAAEGAWPAVSQRVRVAGWDNLPSNQAKPMMQALVEQGPVVVAVDANDWFDYDSGIFDGCKKDAILGHAVLTKGYGSENGKGYWLIQNSWGSGWGEQGHIRLLRHGADQDDSWCGTDNKPKEGVGCDGGPAEVTVCGMCGLLYDPVVPQGVRLEGADGSPAAGSAPSWMATRSFRGSTTDYDFDALEKSLEAR